jgi:uncharacterized protein (TIGR00369 family)
MASQLPRNPDFEKAVRESFARQAFMSTLGARLELVEPARVHVGVAFSDALGQHNNFLHGGVITSIADSACGYAALTLAPADYDVLVVEFKINLLSPARAPRFLACANVLRAGRTISVSSAEVFGIDDAGGRQLVASMLSTVVCRLKHISSSGPQT